jgi:desulfoferrodoxin (superoxide reductase-like protein)
MRLFFASLATCSMLLAGQAARADDKSQDLEQLKPDFDKVAGAKEDPKHTPAIKAPDKVNAGEWFNVTINIGDKALHPSLVEHHVRWISLEADGVEINRVYLHPVLSKPEVTFTIALPDDRTFDKDGNVTARKDRTVTLRAVEAPTHASQFWSEKKITVMKSTAAPKAPAPKK